MKKLYTSQEVISLLEELREKTKVYGLEHTGMGIIRMEINCRIHKIKHAK